jgi:hypothetical protein
MKQQWNNERGGGGGVVKTFLREGVRVGCDGVE